MLGWGRQYLGVLFGKHTAVVLYSWYMHQLSKLIVPVVLWDQIPPIQWKSLRAVVKVMMKLPRVLHRYMNYWMNFCFYTSSCRLRTSCSFSRISSSENQFFHDSKHLLIPRVVILHRHIATFCYRERENKIYIVLYAEELFRYQLCIKHPDFTWLICTSVATMNRLIFLLLSL